MKTNTVQKVPVSPSPIILMLSPVVILLLFYSLRLSAILGAFLFTAIVLSSPDSYRTRGGSLVPAFGLVALVWLGAAVTVVLSFYGAN
jgi:hypothetical protein